MSFTAAQRQEMNRGQTSLEVSPSSEKPLFVDWFNASQLNTQEDQSHAPVLLEPGRVANKEAAAATGGFNGFSRQSANLPGRQCGCGKSSAERHGSVSGQADCSQPAAPSVCPVAGMLWGRWSRSELGGARRSDLRSAPGSLRGPGQAASLQGCTPFPHQGGGNLHPGSSNLGNACKCSAAGLVHRELSEHPPCTTC